VRHLHHPPLRRWPCRRFQFDLALERLLVLDVLASHRMQPRALRMARAAHPTTPLGWERRSPRRHAHSRRTFASRPTLLVVLSVRIDAGEPRCLRWPATARTPGPRRGGRPLAARSCRDPLRDRRDLSGTSVVGRPFPGSNRADQL